MRELQDRTVEQRDREVRDGYGRQIPWLDSVGRGCRNASYAPYYGRGLIQLTHLPNYRAYGAFRGWRGQLADGGRYPDLGWDPDLRIANNDFACADSAGFYWTCPAINAAGEHINRRADSGTLIDDIVSVSRAINGNVAVQKINGLDIRIQMVAYLKRVLSDEEWKRSEQLTFTWRNRSRPTPFTAVQHTIDVILERQKP